MMAIQQRIISKSIAQSCVGAKFKGFHAPKIAQTFDTVAGVCKKGNFEITSFCDEVGNVVKKVNRYVDKDNNETLIIKTWNKDRSRIRTATSVNGVVKEYSFQFVGGRKGAVLMFEQKLVRSENGDVVDFHSIKACRKSEKPREIFYVANWDGKAPDVQYKNTEGKFLEGERLEYLPMWQPEMALPRYNHVAKFNRMQMDLDDVLPPFEFASMAELNPHFYNDAGEQISSVMSLGATNPYTGLVQIAKAADSNFDIIDIMAHEHRHALDFSKMNRLQYNVVDYHKMKSKMLQPQYLEELKIRNRPSYDFLKALMDFQEKSIAKGMITRKNSKNFEYQYYKWLDKQFDHGQYVKTTQTLKSHDEHPLERGPLIAGKKATDEYLQLRDAIFRVLGVK